MKQQKRLRKPRGASTRELLGLQGFTNYGLQTPYGELAFFLAAVKSECPEMTPLSAQDGEEFVTLSTCEVSREDGWVLVIGRRVQ